MSQDVFYQAVSTASFTLLGLWLLLVEPTRDERRVRAERDRDRDAANPPPAAV